MKSLKKIFIAFLVAIACVACNKEDAPDFLQSTGKEVVITRPVTESFRNIDLGEGVNLVITPSVDSLFEITLQGGKNILSDVETSISDGVLSIKNNNSWNWVRSYKREITAHVTLPNFWRLRYRSSASVRATDTLRLDSLQIEVWAGSGSIELPVVCWRANVGMHGGAADVKFIGRSDLGYLYNISFGTMLFQDFHSNITFVYSNSTNDCYIDSDNIYYKIEGHGNIYYKGIPHIDGYASSIGQLIKLQ